MIKLFALVLLPFVWVRILFWELVGCGVLYVVGHFVITYWNKG